MTTETAKKQSNRAIQRTHATYKKKSEISEALNLIRPYINVSTFKFLSHFLHTAKDGGVTQAKVRTICELAGISTGAYSKTVKPEIEGAFSQPLIIKVDPQKKDKLGRKNKGSAYKSLLPLSVIKHLVREKEAEIKREEEEIWEAIYSQSDITGDITGDITSNPPIPCGSKDESTFSDEQNKSFRENLLEKDLKDYKSIKKTDSFSPKPKKYGLKKEVKAILNQGILKGGLTDDQKQEFGNRIQIALHKTKADITDPEIQAWVYDACEHFVTHYEKEAHEITRDYYGTLYTCIENAVYDCLIAQEDDFSEEHEDYEDYEDYEEFEHEAKHGYNGEYFDENMQREAFKAEYQAALTQICVSKEELDELGIY